MGTIPIQILGGHEGLGGVAGARTEMMSKSHIKIFKKVPPPGNKIRSNDL